MQSGKARTREWVLEFEPADAQTIEPLMGWTASTDTRQQVRLQFATKEEAIAYAERNNLSYQVFKPREQKRRTMSYSDNFKFNRMDSWTH